MDVTDEKYIDKLLGIGVDRGLGYIADGNFLKPFLTAHREKLKSMCAAKYIDATHLEEFEAKRREDGYEQWYTETYIECLAECYVEEIYKSLDGLLCDR